MCWRPSSADTYAYANTSSADAHADSNSGADARQDHCR